MGVSARTKRVVHAILHPPDKDWLPSDLEDVAEAVMDVFDDD